MIKCNDLSDDYLSQMSLWAKANGVPLNLTFELTPFCNFSCVMCYVRLTKEQAAAQGRMMNAEQWLGIARQAKEMGALNICLTGGEPMTHPQFWEIYSQLNKMGFIISLLSNGYLIDEDAISKFRLYGAPGSIKLTLYGASDETYRRTCNSPDGFTKISKAVELIKAEGIPLKMTSTIVRENADDLQDIYKFAREHSVPMQHTISVVRSSRGSTADIEKSRFALDDFPDELTIDALEKNKFPPLKSPFAWCASKGDSLWMTWNGHLQMCSFIPHALITYLYPYFAQNRNNGKWCLKRYKQAVLGLGAVNLLISGGLCLFAPLIIKLMFGEEYMDALPVFRLLSLNYFISGTFRTFSGNLLVTQRKLKFNLVVAIVSSSMNVIADFLFVTRWGSMGAALATVLVVLVTSVANTVYLIYTFKQNSKSVEQNEIQDGGI